MIIGGLAGIGRADVCRLERDERGREVMFVPSESIPWYPIRGQQGVAEGLHGAREKLVR